MKKLAWALLPLAIVSSGCFRQIEPGSVAIKFDAASGISEQIMKPQVVWVNWNQRIISYPTAIRNATYVQNANEGEIIGDGSMHATTAEGAKLPVDITVAYHVDPANAVKAFENFGTSNLNEVQQVFIRSTTNYGVDVIAGKRSIFDLTSKERANFGLEVKEVIQPILEEYGITVDDVAVGEMHPSAEIQQKVTESVTARTQLDTARTELERARVEAQTVATNARKSAELNRLLALQGEKSIELKRLEIRRKAIEKWKAAGGAPPSVGSGDIPFTNLKLR